jgi:hypothetical protein
MLMLHPSTLDAAKRRISLVYQNVIFDEADERDSEWMRDNDEQKDPSHGIILVQIGLFC